MVVRSKRSKRKRESFSIAADAAAAIIEADSPRSLGWFFPACSLPDAFSASCTNPAYQFLSFLTCRILDSAICTRQSSRLLRRPNSPTSLSSASRRSFSNGRRGFLKVLPTADLVRSERGREGRKEGKGVSQKKKRVFRLKRRRRRRQLRRRLQKKRESINPAAKEPSRIERSRISLRHGDQKSVLGALEEAKKAQATPGAVARGVADASNESLIVPFCACPLLLLAPSHPSPSTALPSPERWTLFLSPPKE